MFGRAGCVLMKDVLNGVRNAQEIAGALTRGRCSAKPKLQLS